MQLTARLPTKAKLQETGSLALCLQPPANKIGLRGQNQPGFSARCLNRGTSKRSNVCLPCLLRPPHPSSLGVAPPAQPLLTVAPLTLAHQQILSGIKEEKKECGEGGVGVCGVEIRPLQKYNLFFCFFGPPFFSQRRLGVWQSARGMGDNGTLCTSRSPETPRWGIGPLVGGDVGGRRSTGRGRCSGLKQN